MFVVVAENYLQFAHQREFSAIQKLVGNGGLGVAVSQGIYRHRFPPY